MILLWVFIFNLTIAAAVEVHERTLNRIHVKEKGFAVLSYRYNERGSKASNWVERILGAKAVSEKEKYVNNQTFTPFDAFRAGTRTSIAVQSECSFELLGYARLGKDRPFTYDDRATLITGNASISIARDDIFWNCSYRSMVESWRRDQQNQYSAIFFYCPAPSSAECDKHKLIDTSKEKKPTGFIKMALTDVQWSAPFAANHLAPKIRQEKLLRQKDSNTVPMAACLVLPYVSPVNSIAAANRAILFEWVRHHTALGIKVIIFDRNGANRNAIFDSSYGRSQGSFDHGRLSYSPWTVAELFEKNQTVFGYDNNEPGDLVHAVSKRDRIGQVDNDKTLTLTYCRFEASAVYGIDNVMVMDSDEFFFCQGAAASYTAQESWLSHLVRTHEKETSEELSLLSLLTALQTHGGKYKHAAECVTDKISNKSSIFECFAPADYTYVHCLRGKCIHIGYNCPLTDFHGSRSNCNVYHRYLGHNPGNSEVCHMLHLTLDAKAYDEKKRFNNETIKDYEAMKSELWHMSHRKTPQFSK